ncbi:MAG: Brp/Blh family beta-carotene 15,15'-dioxygenase [Rubrobacteraceae bacterium]
MQRRESALTEMRVSPGARQTLMRFIVIPSWVIVGVMVLAFLAGFSVSGPIQYAPFAFSLILFGLPHGAVDHLVPGRLSAGDASIGSIIAVAILYAVLATIYLVFWTFLPVAAFVFFILLTWFHWGQGDLYSTVTLLRAQNPAPRTLKALMVVVRGGLPMLVPLLAFPEAYRDVAESIVGLFSDDGGEILVFEPAFRLTAGIVFLVLALITLSWGYFISSPQDTVAWAMDAAEVALLAAYFAVVPPVFALGMYFCLWHAPRHIARLMLLNRSSSNALQKGEFLPAMKDFVRDATPLTAVSLLLLVGLYFFVPRSVEGVAGLLALYLVLISALTLPHVVIVGLMDRRQGLWR